MLPQRTCLYCLMMHQPRIKTSWELFEQIIHIWRSGRMYSWLWNCPLQIVCPCRTWNLVDILYVTKNLFCTAMLVASGMISHYPGLWIVWCALSCIFEPPISVTIDQRYSHGVYDLYKWHIQFLLSQSWQLLLTYLPSSLGIFQWKHFTLLYQTHKYPIHLYTG